MMEKRIPTILGLLVLVTGIFSGVFLAQNSNIFSLSAADSLVPQNVRVSNINHNSFTVSWSTKTPTLGIVRFGSDPTRLSNIATNNNDKSYTHHIEISNLSPLSEYFFQIYSNSKSFPSDENINSIKTGREIAPKPVSELASGRVVTGSGLEVSKALVYIEIPGGNLLSDTTSNNGGWVIPVSNMRSKDLNNYLRIKDDDEVRIFIDAGPLGSLQIKTKAAHINPVPPIVLGEERDETNNTFDFDDEIPPATLNID